MARKALIAGPTGLVGGQLLNLLLGDDHYDSVIAVTRRKLDNDNPKLVEVIADFDDIDQKLAGIPVDDVFCCLGTTIKKAGSNQQFRKIDYDYPLKIADLTRRNGAKQYLLISALGAKKGSSIFYNQVKGEVEEAVGSVVLTVIISLDRHCCWVQGMKAGPGKMRQKRFIKSLGSCL